MTAAELENVCTLTAQRLSLLKRTVRAGILRQGAVPRLHPEAARTTRGVDRRRRQARLRLRAGRHRARCPRDSRSRDAPLDSQDHRWRQRKGITARCRARSNARTAETPNTSEELHERHVIAEHHEHAPVVIKERIDRPFRFGKRSDELLNNTGTDQPRSRIAETTHAPDRYSSTRAR